MSSTIEGRIISADDKKPISDAVVTLTSPVLEGEQTTVSDSDGGYSFDGLPPGIYTLRCEADSFKSYARGGIAVAVDKSCRVNVELLPQGLGGSE